MIESMLESVWRANTTRTLMDDPVTEDWTGSGLRALKMGMGTWAGGATSTLSGRTGWLAGFVLACRRKREVAPGAGWDAGMLDSALLPDSHLSLLLLICDQAGLC